ncbi:MAG: hypothetical protein ACI9H8_001714 [Lysobacterales bacterium]|jgi:hypothetical protein
MALLFSGKFTVSPDVISEQVLDETLLLNIKTLVYIRLDSLAGSLWQLLTSHHDVESVYSELKVQQQLPEQQLEQFFNGCMGGFQRAQLISMEQPKQGGASS